MDFGHNLIRIRTERGVSRKELAERLGIPYTTLRNYENGEREPGHKTLIALSNIFGITVDDLIGNTMKGESSSPSPEAMKVAVAYDQADEKSRKIARLALEDFMETPVPAMAKRRPERTAANDSPGMDTWHIRDAYWRETLSQWLKEHPDASISSGDVPEWVEFNVMRAAHEEGLPGWTKEELRERAERLFEHPWAGQANIVFPSEMNAEAERRRRRKSAGDFAESSGGKTECSSCAQCPLVGRCSQRFSEKPFPGLRFGLQVVDGVSGKEPADCPPGRGMPALSSSKTHGAEKRIRRTDSLG